MCTYSAGRHPGGLDNRDLTELERRFHKQVMEDVELAKSHGYNPTRFLSVVAKDPKLYIGVARKLLAAAHWQEGFERMWELGLVDKTIEGRAIEEPWCDLFSAQEQATARKRIAAINRG